MSTRERIKQARLELLMTQKEFAAALDIDPITVSRWERGETAPGDLHRVKLSRLTGKSPNWFLGEGAGKAA